MSVKVVRGHTCAQRPESARGFVGRHRIGKLGAIASLSVGLGAVSIAALAAGCSGADSDETTAASDLIVSDDLVISQVYGGGGNSGAQFKNDFIELTNRGKTPVSLAGKTLQYAPYGVAFSASVGTIALPNATLAPGKFFLVKLTGGANGVDLPAADAVSEGGMAVNLAKDKGKIALVASNALLDGCGAEGAPCAAGAFIDLIGYGAASQSEGAPTAALANTTAAIRRGGGCTDTGNNAADFELGAPSPRNSASPAVVCHAAEDAGAPDASANDAASDASADAAKPDAGDAGNDAGPAPADAGDAGKTDAGPTSLVLLNEVKINPPTTQDAPYEYAELLCTPGMSLAGYYFAALEGDGDSSTGSPGVVDLAVDLGGASCGANGLVYIKAAGGGHASLAAQTTVVTSAALDQGTSPFENATTSFVVIKSPTPITTGADYDPGNAGNLELPLGASIVDGFSVFEQSDGAIDHTYAPRLSMKNGTVDAAVRIVGNKTALSTAAWYGGDLAGTAADSLAFDPAKVTSNFPANAVLTPGGANSAGDTKTKPSTPDESEPTSTDEEVGADEDTGDAQQSGKTAEGRRYVNPSAPPPRVQQAGCSAASANSANAGAGVFGIVLAAAALLGIRRKR